MRIVAVASRKGGVGKSSVAINLAAVLAEQYRVLLIDCDPQDAGSAAWWFGDGEGFDFEARKETNVENLARLREIKAPFDVVVADTPPSISDGVLATVAAASDLLIIPSEPDDAELLASIQTVKLLPDDYEGQARVLLTKVDARSMAQAQAAQAALIRAGVQTFGSVVRLLRANKRARSAHTSVSRVKVSRSVDAATEYALIGSQVADILGLVQMVGPLALEVATDG